MSLPVPYHETHFRPAFCVGSGTFRANFTTSSLDFTRDVTGSAVVKRPGWRKLPKIQIGQPLAYNRVFASENAIWSDESRFRSGPGGALDWFSQSSIITSPWDVSTEYDITNYSNSQYKALNRLFDKMKGEGTNIANMLAERRQTIQSVGDTIKRIALVIHDLRRGDVTSATRRLFGDPGKAGHAAKSLSGKDVANQWIALQYGWLPLCEDVYGLVNKLHVRSSTAWVTFHASASSSTSALSKRSWAWQLGTFKGFTTSKCTMRYMIRAKPNLKLASPAALGLTNPLVPLWEVIPWSFVVDWFLPVGNYLEQLSADHGWTFIDGCLSSKETCFGVVDPGLVRKVIFAPPLNTDIYTVQMKGAGAWTRFNRTLLTGFPNPKLPRFKNPVSSAHVKNAIALLVQQFH